jgi:uncharacterized Ntn-hydrolase superfamily protein
MKTKALLPLCLLLVSVPSAMGAEAPAALKAGDEAGGDSRGRQSASLLVVRKQGGRNINNDRYVFINVDDHPQPLVELRRLLDLNLAHLYAGAADRIQETNNLRGALDAARTAARYAPGISYVRTTLGFLEYLSGDKEAALRELRGAQALEPDFRKQLEAILARSPELAALKEDREFLDKLFPPP